MGIFDKIRAYPFSSAAIIISLAIIIIGGSFISKAYAPAYPLKPPFTILNLDKNLSIDTSCWSLHNYDQPVEGDFFTCNILFKDLNLYDGFELNGINPMGKYRAFHYPGSVETNGTVYLLELEEIDETTSIGRIRNIPIGYAGRNEFYMIFEIRRDSPRTVREINSGFIKYATMSLPEYNRWKGEKSGLYLSLVVLALLAVSGIRSFKEIYDKEKKPGG